MTWIQLATVASLVLILATAVLAVFAKSLILSAIALGVGSALFAALLFLLGASYAGGFELSVGAGLISILFIVAISLIQAPQRSEPDEA